MTLYTHQSKNIRKTWLLMSVFFVVVISIGWLFARLYGNSAFFVIAVGFSLFMNFFSYWFSDKIVLAMSRAHPRKREKDLELYRILAQHCLTARLEVKDFPQCYKCRNFRLFLSDARQTLPRRFYQKTNS